MFNAYISGRYGKLIYEADGSFFSVTPGCKPQPVTLAEIRQMRFADAEYEVFECASLDEARSLLAQEKLFADCLFLTLSVINLGISLTSRLACAQALEHVLEDGRLKERLLRRLLSRPLPVEQKTDRHSVLSSFRAFDRTTGLLEEVFEAQEVLSIIHGAYKRESDSYLETSEAEDLKAELDAVGLFSDLAIAANTGDDEASKQAVVNTLIRVRSRPYAFAANKVLNATRIEVFRSSPLAKAAKQRRLALTSEFVGNSESSKIRQRRTVEDLLNSDVDNSFNKLTPYETKSAVDRQLEGIQKQIVQGRQDLVTKYVVQLIAFQLTSGEKEHLAKSLCLLATAALAANQLAIADELSAYALKLHVDDHFIYTIRGEVLKHCGAFDAAIDAYREAKLRYPSEPYAWNGEPDVLKDAGRFEEALQSYEEVRARFPDNDVASVGYVSTLRRKGDFAGAISQALKVMRHFPESSVARFELGSSLLAKGSVDASIRVFHSAFVSESRDARIVKGYVHALNVGGQASQALSIIRRQVSRHPNAPAFLNLLADQHRNMGNLSAAQKVLADLIAAYPGYAPAKYNLASILLCLQSFEEAKRQLPTQNLRSQEDWFGYRLYLIGLLATSPEDARTAAKDAIENCPWPAVRSRLESVYAMALARTKQRSSALVSLQAGLERLSDPQKQCRLALIGAVQATAGRNDLAQMILTKILKTREPQLLAFRDAVVDGNIPDRLIVPVLMAA